MDCIYGFFIAADCPELLELFADDWEDCYTSLHTEEEAEPGLVQANRVDKQKPKLTQTKE